MQCPICLTPALDARHSNGIEVDVCPDCGGVWLDRGELEKLMVQAKTEPALGVYEPPSEPSESSVEEIPGDPEWNDRSPDDDDEDRKEWKSDRRSRDRDDDDDDDKKRKKKRKKGWGDRLEDVLDDVLDLDDLFD